MSSVADLCNAGISFGRGDNVGGGLSLAAAIPVVGAGANAARLARTGQKLIGAAQPTVLSNGIKLTGHAVERLAGRESHVTGSMIQTTLRRGEVFWDPKNQTNN